ncbi:transcriptional regulator [Vibrio breoganii]|uniref:helix-turn-helix domain-containing protein n=1 Tax=Vibrio breoganii TaxID=553239 RepID=UPI000C866E4E|nr:helix-turn-helix transcriptional regulator [Vibrio breoganii]PMG79278.1 transcriptional regulator [Vibrio breoganii]PMI13712.1 transcriptional regulator [Vibrio breoganii]PMK38738.1 transcriptional regulator [Vibrio breoganii]PML18408.1 transcriptional regulator [Vibrio breoganii]PML36187.1 transcriptional regulator [Vibrio breoganii]
MKLKCNLSRILGERRMKISDLSRETGIHRNILTRIYNETATRVDLEVVAAICSNLEVTVGELYQVEKSTNAPVDDV